MCVANVQLAGNQITSIADYICEQDLERHLIVASWVPENEHRKNVTLRMVIMK